MRSLTGSIVVGETAVETLERLNEVLSPENRAAINKTLANLRDFTGGLNQRLAELDRTLATFNAAATEVSRAGARIADAADGVSRDLRPALQQADKTMKDISQAALALERQVGELSQALGSTALSSGDQFTTVTTELKATSATLNRLLDRLQDPRAALLGANKQQRGPGE